MKKYKIINTFSQKPSFAQIVAYLVFLMQVLIFYILVQKHYESQSVRIAMITLFSISVVTQGILALATSMSDPSDSLMVNFKNQREK